MNPYDTAHELAQSIRGAEQFLTLKEVRARIEQDETTLHMVQDYRKRQWELQAKQLQGQPVSAEERAAFDRLTEVVSLNRDVKQYLELEMYWNTVLMDIYGILSNTLSDATLPLPWVESAADD